ncbi:MAG: diguanylate cyclase domain-containing protein [Nocardioidaceae bacterium]
MVELSGPAPRRSMLPEGVIIWDRSGRVLRGSFDAVDAVGLVWGIDAGVAPLTAPYWRAVDDEGQPLREGAYPARMALRTGDAVRRVIGAQGPDGAIEWLRVSAVPLDARRTGELTGLSLLGDSNPPDAFVAVLTMFTICTDEVVQATSLALSEQRFRLTVDNAPIGVALVDLDGRWLRVNQRLCAILGYPEDVLLDLTFQDITHAEDLDSDLELRARLLAGDIHHYELQKRYHHANGRVVWAKLAVALVRDVTGEPLHFVSQIEDVTAIRDAHEQLERLALHDPLTGVANRILFLRRLKASLTGSRTYDGDAALAYVDVDLFKQVNDTFGHGAGDSVLRAVADRLSSVVRLGDTVGRIGGDEFGVLIDGVATDEDLADLMRRLRQAVQQPVDVGGATITPSVSVGIRRSGPDSTAESMLRESDIALYAAKAAGRGRWEQFETLPA